MFGGSDYLVIEHRAQIPTFAHKFSVLFAVTEVSRESVVGCGAFLLLVSYIRGGYGFPVWGTGLISNIDHNLCKSSSHPPYKPTTICKRHLACFFVFSNVFPKSVNVLERSKAHTGLSSARVCVVLEGL